MLEHRSALASVYRRYSAVHGAAPPVAFWERVSPTLVQVSGWPDTFPRLSSKLEVLLSCFMPKDGLRAVSQGQRSIFRVAPERLWLVGRSDDDVLRSLTDTALTDGVVTSINHSRT